MIKYIKKNPLLLVVLIFVMILIGLIIHSSIKDTKEKNEIENQVTALTDSVRIWKDKDFLNNAEITALNSQVFILGDDILMKDRELAELQALINKYKIKNKNNSVVNVKAETVFQDKKPIGKDTIIYKDRLVVDVYNFSDDWITTNIYTDSDTVFFNAKIRNSYAVMLHDERKNMFSKSKIVAHVVNKNPYTQVTAMKAYYVEAPKAKKFGIGPNISYGLNSEGNTSFFLGIGLQYNVLRF